MPASTSSSTLSATGIPTLRPASVAAVFHYAWGCAEFTATEAMGATGLTRSTTIEAIEALRDARLVAELPNAREIGDYRKGRPARRFSLEHEAAVLIGVDAGNSHIAVTVADLRSHPLAQVRATRELDSDDASARQELLTRLIDEALRDAGRPREDVLAVCIGVPAPVDKSGRSPRHPTGFWERMNPNLVDVFSWAPLVRIENDASLAAFAEAEWGAARGCDDYVTLLAGDRLGAGVVVDGHLLRGRHGGVGEMVAFDHVEGVGSADGLGIRATRLAAQAVAAGEVGPRSPLGALTADSLDGRAVLEVAHAGDPIGQRIVQQVGDVLARVVSVLGSMYDPQRVIVSGAIAEGIGGVVDAARRSLPTDIDLPAPELVASTLGADIVVRGAVAAAAARARAAALTVWSAREPT